MLVSLLFHKLTCMTVRLYIFYPYPKLAALFLNVIALFPKFREKCFMYVINKRVFLWKSKDSSNNTLTDNVSSRLTIVFAYTNYWQDYFFFQNKILPEGNNNACVKKSTNTVYLLVVE